MRTICNILEGICLLVNTFMSASLLVVIHFCRYVFHLFNKNLSIGVQLCSEIYNFKAYYYRSYANKNLYVKKFIHNKICV
jgi:hypothetical protein